MPRAKLTSKGQVTVPKEIRDHLKLKPGDKVFFWIRRDGKVQLDAHNVDFWSLRGILKYTGPPVSVKEMNEAIGQFHAAEDDRIRHQYARSAPRPGKRRSTTRRA